MKCGRKKISFSRFFRRKTLGLNRRVTPLSARFARNIDFFRKKDFLKKRIFFLSAFHIYEMRKKKKSFSLWFDFSGKKKILFWGKFENKKILFGTNVENGFFRSENAFSNSTRATTADCVT